MEKLYGSGANYGPTGSGDFHEEVVLPGIIIF